MRARSLMYHNVVDEGAVAPPKGDRYTFGRAAFVAHLDAVERALRGSAVRVVPRVTGDGGFTPLVLTFDDGEDGAFPLTADLLEARGWRGQFFIVSDAVGRAGHIDADAVRALHRRGHVIGTHTATHPRRMSALPVTEQEREWRRSVSALEEIIGEPVTVGSVPGGFYSESVARTAAAAGVRQLYTSEPTTAVGVLAGCQVLGRYTIKTNTPPETAAALAVGRLPAMASQAVTWQAKKAAKRVGGEAYLRVRRRLLGLQVH